MGLNYSPNDTSIKCFYDNENTNNGYEQSGSEILLPRDYYGVWSRDRRALMSRRRPFCENYRGH